MTTLRVYLDGSAAPAKVVEATGSPPFTLQVEAGDGSRQIEATRQEPGEEESVRVAVNVSVDGLDAPTITSPRDWSEAASSPLTVSIQAFAGEALRVYVNGVLRASPTANGSGLASASVALDAAAVVGIDCVDTIEVRRVVGADLSRAARARVVPVVGRLEASGVSHARVLHAASLLCNRYWVPGPWQGETLWPVFHRRGPFRGGAGSAGQPPSLPEVELPTYKHGAAPGWLDAAWCRLHAERLTSPPSGVLGTATLDGTAVSTTRPLWFDVGLMVASAYYRGDRGVWERFKARLLAVLAAAPRNAGGMPLGGNDRSYWANNHLGFASANAETENTARWIWVAELLRSIASTEGDAASVSTLDGQLTALRAALAGQVLVSGYLSASADGGTGYGATAVACAVAAFASTGHRDAAIAKLAADLAGLHPASVGALHYAASHPGPWPEDEGGPRHGGIGADEQQTTVYVGPYAAAIAAAAPAAARALVEAAIRSHSKWHRAGINRLGLSTHTEISNYTGSHPAHDYRNPMGLALPAWVREADDPHADLPALTMSGALGSESSWLSLPFGHRIATISVLASSGTQATIEIVAQESANWVDQSDLGADAWTSPEVVMQTIAVDGATAAVTSGVKPIGCYGGHRFKARVAAVTGPPASFTVTLHQPRLTPSLVADATLGFTDTFERNRLAEYVALIGSAAGVERLAETDAPGAPALATPRSMLRSVVGGWTGLVQAASSWADGSVELGQVIHQDNPRPPVVTVSNYPSFGAILRNSGAGTYVLVKFEPVSGLVLADTTPATGIAYRATVEEWVGGVLQLSQSWTADWSVNFNAEFTASGSEVEPRDEICGWARAEGASLHVRAWGGRTLPFAHAIGYGGDAGHTFTLQHVLGAGRAGFALYGRAKVETVRVCGKNAQPVPPGYVLDTGLRIPRGEYVPAQAFVSGEWVSPASDAACLRNEWGAIVAGPVMDHAPRWSY